MKIEKITINWLSFAVAISFLLSISIFIFPNSFPNKDFLIDISIGIFCSGLVVLVTSVISFSIKFRSNMEEMLFYCKRIIAIYRNTRTPTYENIQLVSEKLELLFQDFYFVYKNTEFNFFNKRLNKNTKELFEWLIIFLRPFLLINENIGKDEESMEWVNSSLNDIKTITKAEFANFLTAYEDLYLVYDPKMYKDLQKISFFKTEG
jgi:hypothetical protein